MSKRSSRSIARKRFWNEHNKQTYRCPDCGRTNDEVEGSIEVHHQNGSPYDNRVQNLIGLCGVCHALREDRHPSKDRVRRLVDEVKTEDGMDSKGQARQAKSYSMKTAMEISAEVSETMSNPLFEHNYPVYEGLGFSDFGSLFNIQPKTRREVALFRLGRFELHQEISSIVHGALSDVRSTVKCACCKTKRARVVCPHPNLDSSHTVRREPLCDPCAMKIRSPVYKENDDDPEVSQVIAAVEQAVNSDQCPHK